MAAALRGPGRGGRLGARGQAQCGGLRRPGSGEGYAPTSEPDARCGRGGLAATGARRRLGGARGPGEEVPTSWRARRPPAPPRPARAYLQRRRSRKSGATTHMQIPPGRRGGHTPPPLPRSSPAGTHVHPPAFPRPALLVRPGPGLPDAECAASSPDPQRRPARHRV